LRVGKGKVHLFLGEQGGRSSTARLSIGGKRKEDCSTKESKNNKGLLLKGEMRRILPPLWGGEKEGGEGIVARN